MASEGETLGDGETGFEPGHVNYIGLNQIPDYGKLVAEKWEICCTVLDNLISFDGSGEIDGLSLVNILQSVGIEENLDQILLAVETRSETVGEPLTKRVLENNCFAAVQEMPNFPIEKIFETAIQSTIDHQTVLIIGLLGRGKSALSQYLVSGVHDSEDKTTFVSGDMGMSGGGVTTDFWVGHFPFLGDGSGMERWVTVIDTPGGNDEKLPNFENFKRLQNVVKKVRFINTILLVVTAQDIMRRTESLNTYLQEFALMLQQDKLCDNVAVIISRGHMLVPAFFPNEERFAHALEESIMSPLREAFGGDVPCYRLSMSKTDYLADPSLEFKVKETACEIYERFLNQKPLDCQKMVSLETRIKRLIHQHVALEEDHKHLEKDHANELAQHKDTTEKLEETTKNLERASENLDRTTNSLGETKEDLQRWREKHAQCFSMLREETDRHNKTREQLDTEREQHRETQEKWTKEVEDHHATQGRLETEIRDHKAVQADLEEKEIDLEKTAQELDDKTGELKQLKSSSKKTAEEYAESEKARKELAEKLRNKSNGMCVISCLSCR